MHVIKGNTSWVLRRSRRLVHVWSNSAKISVFFNVKSWEVPETFRTPKNLFFGIGSGGNKGPRQDRTYLSAMLTCPRGQSPYGWLAVSGGRLRSILFALPARAMATGPRGRPRGQCEIPARGEPFDGGGDVRATARPFTSPCPGGFWPGHPSPILPTALSLSLFLSLSLSTRVWRS